MNTLSYPIGPFEMPGAVAAEDIQIYIQEIADLPANFKAAVAGLSNEQLDTPYRPEGWTVRQVVHHVPDSHMSGYKRFHWALTEDKPTIKDYNEKAWAALSYQRQMPPEVSLGILESLHMRWVYLFRSLTETDWQRTFVHPDPAYDGEYRLTDALAMYAWHGKHHLAHITSLKERMQW